VDDCGPGHHPQARSRHSRLVAASALLGMRRCWSSRSTCGKAKGKRLTPGVLVRSEMPKTVDGNLWGFQLWVRGPDRFPACAALAAPKTGVAASVSAASSLGIAASHAFACCKLLRIPLACFNLLRCQCINEQPVCRD